MTMRMNSCSVVVVALLAVILVLVECNKVGPPVDQPYSNLCSTMMPQHDASVSNTTAPYEIITSQQCYKPGQTIKVTIRAKTEGGGHRHSIYGLFMMARPAEDRTFEAAYGTFSTDNEHLQTLPCFETPNSAIGHHHGHHDHVEEDDDHQEDPHDDEGHHHEDDGENHEGHAHEEHPDHEGHDNHEGHDHSDANEDHDDEGHEHEGDSHDEHVHHDDHDHGHDDDDHEHKSEETMGHDHSHHGHHNDHEHHAHAGTAYERQFEWTAGADNTIDIVFRATVVEHKPIYWMDIDSSPLRYDVDCKEMPYEVVNEDIVAEKVDAHASHGADASAAPLCQLSTLSVVALLFMSFLFKC